MPYSIQEALYRHFPEAFYDAGERFAAVPPPPLYGPPPIPGQVIVREWVVFIDF